MAARYEAALEAVTRYMAALSSIVAQDFPEAANSAQVTRNQVAAMVDLAERLGALVGGYAGVGE